MRTTLDIDEDLLQAAKELARLDGVSAGAVVSRLLRQALTGQGARPANAPKAVGGFLPFHASPGVVTTTEQVRSLMDSEGI
ncbi:MAG: hypothetical protein JO006_10120 [Paucibacter sp.]|nr:hypothetical protein [Roseateles sp.]